MTPARKPRSAAQQAQASKPNAATISEAATAAIANYLRSGCSIAEAARLANIPGRTVTHWRTRGRAEAERIETGRAPILREGPYLRFWQDSETSRTRRKVLAMSVVQDLMNPSHDDRIRLQAAMFYLERNFPDEFGRRNRDPEREPKNEEQLAADAEQTRREALGALDELEERRGRKSG